MKTTRDLTCGSVSAHLVRLAVPLMLGNLLQQFYNTIDAWVLGRYAGELEFAAIGIAGSVMNLFLFAIVGACTGISVIFAQFYGAGDMERFRREHFLSALFGLLCVAAGSGAGILCVPFLLRLIRVPAELTGLAQSYLFIVLLGLPSAFLYNLYSALLRSAARTGAVNTAGTAVISAYTATTRIEGFANSFGDSGPAATSVMVAQNLGRGETERVRESFRRSLVLLLALGAGMSLAMYSTAGSTAGLLLGRREGVSYESACGYIRYISLFYVLCFTGNTFAGYFDGRGRVSIPFIGAAGHITLRAVLSWLLVPRMGLNAVALATGTGWLLVNLFWAAIYRKTEWRSDLAA